MAATFSPTFTIDLTNQIGTGNSATITLPNGSWHLSSVTTTGNTNSTIAVSNGTNDALPATAVGDAKATLPATDPSVVFEDKIIVTCAGAAATLNDTVLRLTSAIGQSLTVVVAPT